MAATCCAGRTRCLPTACSGKGYAMELKRVSAELEEKLSELFVELRSGISEREDSRSFGAMIEKRITDNRNHICSELGYTAWDRDIMRFYDLFCRSCSSTLSESGPRCDEANRSTGRIQKEWLQTLHFRIKRKSDKSLLLSGGRNGSLSGGGFSMPGLMEPPSVIQRQDRARLRSHCFVSPDPGRFESHPNFSHD